MNFSPFLSSELRSSTILHRPTPIHPITGSTLLTATSNYSPSVDADTADAPLDLSQSGAARQQPVIQAAPLHCSFLPTCVNPNLNSNWIAIKFGAAAGPNRMSYPREFKLMVINYYYANGQNKYRTCKEFQITKSMLNGWLQKIDKIRQSRPGSLKSGRSGRKPQFPDIEKQLFTLYSAHLGNGQKVGNRWIRETARNLAQQQCSQQELAGMCQFSERWLSNFKKRYHINLNRDWSSGSSSLGSGESVGSASSTTGDSGHPSPNNHDESVDGDGSDTEDCTSDMDSAASDSLDTLIDMDECQNSLMSSIGSDQQHISEIINKPGQLPIQAFYERFPWLCRKNNVGTEPGRRGRKVQFPDVEKVLFERLQQRQSSGDRISNRWLQEQARQLATQLCPNVLEEATKSARCLFSEHWLHNFKKRYGVSLKQSNATSKCASSSVVSNAECCTEPPPPPSVSTAVIPVPQEDSSVDVPHGSAPSASLSGVLNFQNWFVNQCYPPSTSSFSPISIQHSPTGWHHTSTSAASSCTYP
ncbi:hypothetical protein Tcan_11332 [Toxocara canis]|nr:hypothetical protein Tcan_11332 [Toxocara canis]